MQCMQQRGNVVRELFFSPEGLTVQIWIYLDAQPQILAGISIIYRLAWSHEVSKKDLTASPLSIRPVPNIHLAVDLDPCLSKSDSIKG